MNIQRAMQRLRSRYAYAPILVFAVLGSLLVLSNAETSLVVEEHILAATQPGSVQNVTLLPNGSLLWEGRVYSVPPPQKPHSDWDDLLHPDTAGFWIYVTLVFSCVLAAGMAAGLTMGLVSVDAMKLHVTLEAELSDDDEAEENYARMELREEMLLKRKSDIRNGAPASQGELADIDAELRRLSLRNDERAEHEAMKEEKALARRILPVVEKHHLLLVTLLLTNAVANECMPIFLDQIVPSWLAVCLSVSFVLVFGEIVPSAIFTGKHQLRIAAFFTPFVQLLMFLTGPVSYPIAMALDYSFGKEEHEAYNKDELKALIRMHGQREPHQAVVILRPHVESQSLTAPVPPSEDELDASLSDAKMLNVTDSQGQFDPHDARFCTTTESEFKRWLEKMLLDCAFYPSQEWEVLMHPLSNERRDANKPRAHIGFASPDEARQVSEVINSRIRAEGGGAWLHGWVRVEAEVAENKHAVRMQKLAEDECAILCGVIGIGETPVGEAAHLIDEIHQTSEGKLHRIFMLAHNTILDRGVLADVMRRGHSRLPIYQVNEFDVSLKRRSAEHSFGIALAHPGVTKGNSEATWGHWNRIGYVDPDSSAARCALDDTFFISAVNGVRVKKLEDFKTQMATADDEVTITVYRDSPEERKRICGMLLAKRLLVLSPEDYRMVGDVTERFPLAVAPDETLLEALSRFRQGDSHMAIVTNNPEVLQECWREYRKARLPSPEDIGKRKEASTSKGDPLAWAAPLQSGQVEVLGLLTLEDVIEEFMGDIKDETDTAEREPITTRNNDRARRVTSISNAVMSKQERGLKSPYSHIPRLRHHPPSAGLGSSTKFISRLAHVKSSTLPSELASGSAGTLTPLGETTPLLGKGKLTNRYQSCTLNSSGRFDQ